tara:strand:- start:2429 stop:2695 length:267 start_codon:yes stop_codon:yes gene_type:complete
MKAFRAAGSFRTGKSDQEFTVDIVADDKDDAMERVFSNFGSRHRVPRRFVLVDSISEIDPSESTAPTVVAYFGPSKGTPQQPPKSEEE